MKTIALKIPDEDLIRRSHLAASLGIHRAEYIRIAIALMNKRTVPA